MSSGLGHQRVQALLGWNSPPLVRCCSEAFVATRVAESFIMFYLVPKFDKTSFYFSPRMTRLHVIVCLH